MNTMHTLIKISLLTLVLPTALHAQLSYVTNSGAITITSYNTAAGLNAVIPATINGYPVTSIGQHAFFNRTSLTSVTIPNSVTNIGNSAFQGCNSLTSVIIPNSVTYIGVQAFASCGLRTMTIGTGITYIDNYAFEYCPYLTSLYFQGKAPNGNLNYAVFGDGFGYGYTADPATAYYMQGTSGWGATFDGIPAVPMAATPPAQAISTYSNQPAVFFPAAAGAGYVLQMTTNLATGAWVTVTNSTPISGFIISNPPPNAFFRLNNPAQ